MMRKVILTLICLFFIGASDPNILENENINNSKMQSIKLINNFEYQLSKCASVNSDEILQYYWVFPMGPFCMSACTGGWCCKIEIIQYPV